MFTLTKTALAFGAVVTTAAATLVVADLAGADASAVPTAKACATAAGFLRLADGSGHCASGYHALTLPDAHLGQTYQLITDYSAKDPVTALTLPAGQYSVDWSWRTNATVFDGATHPTYSVVENCYFRSSAKAYDYLHVRTAMTRSNSSLSVLEGNQSAHINVSLSSATSLTVSCSGAIQDQDSTTVSGNYDVEQARISAVRTGTLHSIDERPSVRTTGRQHRH